MPNFDFIGLGLNATDRLIRVPQFPEPGGKIAFSRDEVLPGGQVAVASVVCRRFGFSASYAGSVGDDEAGAWQVEDLQREGVDLSRLYRVPDATSQQAWIFVEEGSGERTILYDRPAEIAYPVEKVDAAWIASGRVLHLDGHDGAAAARAAELARAAGVPVVVDLNNVYEHQRGETERMLSATTHLVASAAFPGRWMGIDDPVEAVAELRRRYGHRVAAVTLGGDGVLALDDEGYHYTPGFMVEVVDTTGAGDVFHGGYTVGLLEQRRLDDILEFACALAALNCTAPGARGHIATRVEVEALRRHGQRRRRADLLARLSLSSVQ